MKRAQWAAAPRLPPGRAARGELSLLRRPIRTLSTTPLPLAGKSVSCARLFNSPGDSSDRCINSWWTFRIYATVDTWWIWDKLNHSLNAGECMQLWCYYDCCRDLSGVGEIIIQYGDISHTAIKPQARQGQWVTDLHKHINPLDPSI